VAISPESPDRTLTTAEANRLGYPVLSDADNAVARQYRLTHTIAPEVVRYQLGNGNDVAAFNGSGQAEVPLPATYIIDTDGLVQFAFVCADYTQRAEPEDALAVLRDLAAAAHPAPTGARP
jgi:peroxiredoxin